MTSIGKRLIGRLKAHGLFPVPTKPELSARFNRDAIREFHSDYHRLHGELLEHGVIPTRSYAADLRLEMLAAESGDSRAISSLPKT